LGYCGTECASRKQQSKRSREGIDHTPYDNILLTRETQTSPFDGWIYPTERLEGEYVERPGDPRKKTEDQTPSKLELSVLETQIMERGWRDRRDRRVEGLLYAGGRRISTAFGFVLCREEKAGRVS
jgi:hypothetical protein